MTKYDHVSLVIYLGQGAFFSLWIGATFLCWILGGSLLKVGVFVEVALVFLCSGAVLSCVVFAFFGRELIVWKKVSCGIGILTM